MNQPPEIDACFDPVTHTVSYLVSDPESRRCAIIDPVLDFEPKSGRTATRSAEALIARVRERGVQVEWLLETHVHADHLSAAQYLRERLGGRVAIGEQVREVQRLFAPIFNLEADVPCDGSAFDHLFQDGEHFTVGSIPARVIHTPGHTPACVSYLIGDAVFVGDTLFMPDYGTARTDFPGGDARTLYRSIQRLLALPAATRLFTCHDYAAPGRKHFAWESSIAEQARANVHLPPGGSEEDFVRLRTQRDDGLEVPALLLPAVQVNIRAGRLPTPESNGVSYLKIPLNRL